MIIAVGYSLAIWMREMHIQSYLNIFGLYMFVFGNADAGKEFHLQVVRIMNSGLIQTTYYTWRSVPPYFHSLHVYIIFRTIHLSFFVRIQYYKRKLWMYVCYTIKQKRLKRFG